MKYHVSEIAATGEEFPVPGQVLATFDIPAVLGPIGALDAYSEREGFAPYSATEMLDEVTVWGPEMASAPFTNTEIMAYTEEALS